MTMAGSVRGHIWWPPASERPQPPSVTVLWTGSTKYLLMFITLGWWSLVPMAVMTALVGWRAGA